METDGLATLWVFNPALGKASGFMLISVLYVYRKVDYNANEFKSTNK